ncbi:tetratricopeptide repeat protein [Actinomadura sp. 3N508]|uniref:tetratricopeptide repeat protein n=1 Tax=Actinomadura sp. 3N508 TaxID=3375153 RepID=UPI0037A7A120
MLGFMESGARRRVLGFVLLLVAAGVVAAVVPLLPSSWPLAVRALLGTVGAIAGAAAGFFAGEAIMARRRVVEGERAAVAESEARRGALVGTRELAASDEESVAGLLRPERAVVEFVGRVDELERLREWCADEAACPVWLVTGAGGVGKTRLGMRLAESLPFGEWECQPVKPGDEVAAVQAAGRVGQRVLLLVDYAETRPGLAAMLTEVAACEAVGDAGGVRVLLLARQAGEWWTSLDTESDATRDLVARTPVLELAAALDDRRDDVQVMQEALPFYAAVRGRPVPRVRFTVGSAVRLPVLVLHAAALVAVLDDERGTSGGRAAADLGVLDRLLGHERRLWDKAARRAGLAVRLPVLEQVVAAAVLLLDPEEEGDESSLRAVIRRVPDLAVADEERVGALAGWLRQLYPVQGGRVELLRPDLLAERHATSQLAAHELLRRACLTGLGSSEAVRALTVLARACAHHDRAPGLIEEMLRRDLAGLARAAIVVAERTGTRLGDLLADVLRDVPATLEDLRRIAERIPYPTVALATADAVVTRRVRDLLPADADPAEVASWSRHLAVALGQLGRREEALEAVTEAVSVYRTLAQERPDAFLSNLASSLNNQSNHLSDLGRWEEALEAITEAVQIRRQLAQARPDTFLPDLAGSLSNRSNRLSDLGRREEALEASTEAVTAYRTLAEARPGAFLPDLAMSLNNQSNQLSGLGRWEEALEAITEAVQIRRQLAQARPDTFLPDLAMSLNNQSNRLSDLGQREEALGAITEAVQIRRELARARPDAFLPDLAMSLNNQSNRLSDLGQPEEALEAITEAVTAYRTLAEARPDAFLPDLAMSLNNRSNRLSDLGRREEALEAITEAVTAYRTLAEAQPDAFLSDLAMSLNNQSNHLAKLGRREEALEAITEAVQIRRRLVRTQPDAFFPDLASSLNNQSNRLSDLGRREEALEAITEAVTAYRTLAEARPDAFLPNLAVSLNNQSNRLSGLGRREEALEAITEAVTAYRTLAEARPDAFLPNLASSLNNQSIRLGTLGRQVEALRTIDEALQIRQRLARARPSVHQAELDQSQRIKEWLENTPDRT